MECNEFNCLRCGYKTDKISNFKKHLARKLVCPCHLEDISYHDMYVKYFGEKSTIQCEECGEVFSTRQSKWYHKKYKCNPVEKDDIRNKTINNTLNNNNTNNITLNVIKADPMPIREFGNENMAALPKDMLRSCIMTLSYREALEDLHFDPEFKENHNIRLISMKKELMEFYKNNRWQCVSLLKGVNEVIQHICTIFRNFYNRNKDDVIEDVGEEEALKLLDELDETYNLNEKYVRALRKEFHAMLYDEQRNRDDNISI